MLNPTSLRDHTHTILLNSIPLHTTSDHNIQTQIVLLFILQSLLPSILDSLTILFNIVILFLSNLD